MWSASAKQYGSPANVNEGDVWLGMVLQHFQGRGETRREKIGQDLGKESGLECAQNEGMQGEARLKRRDLEF